MLGRKQPACLSVADITTGVVLLRTRALARTDLQEGIDLWIRRCARDAALGQQALKLSRLDADALDPGAEVQRLADPVTGSSPGQLPYS